MVLWQLTFVNNAYVCPAGRHNGGIGTYSGLTKTSTALPRLSSKRTIL
ncbi:TPA: hypothetical protein WI183_002084 [Neisseria meningitidis]